MDVSLITEIQFDGLIFIGPNNIQESLLPISLTFHIAFSHVRTARYSMIAEELTTAHTGIPPQAFPLWIDVIPR
jgi:hypothetical protein